MANGRKVRNSTDLNTPHEGELREAKRNPNGWIYRINGNYLPNEDVPATAIIGAWKVDINGNIIGNFIPNPNFEN